MALGRMDVNVLYRKTLRPVLREFGPAFNIEEIHHGENIDTRILKEIDETDYLLADLTYARPSVYFEAGYAAAKQMPVLYTCRADHVRRGAPHEIHFDVNHRQMILWADPGDRTFADRLRRHVTARTRSLINKLSEERTRTDMEARFASISVAHRLQMLAQMAQKILVRAGFRPFERDQDRDSPWRGYRRLGALGQTAEVSVSEGWPFRPTGAQFVPLVLGLREHPKAFGGVTRTDNHLIVVCLRKVTRPVVEKCFPEYSYIPSETGQTRSWSYTVQLGRPSEMRLLLHVLGDVRSEEMLREHLALISRSMNSDRAGVVRGR
jgi:nucleoside 2-deoxyribosyltransferase